MSTQGLACAVNSYAPGKVRRWSCHVTGVLSCRKNEWASSHQILETSMIGWKEKVTSFILFIFDSILVLFCLFTCMSGTLKEKVLDGQRGAPLVPAGISLWKMKQRER